MGDSTALVDLDQKDADSDVDINLNPNCAPGDALVSVAHSDSYGHQVEIDYVVEPGISPIVSVPTTSETHYGPIPVQATGSRSIEIFFGKFTTFQNFYQVLCDHGVSAPPESEQSDSYSTKMKPESIRKLVLVGHPINSFSGMNKFIKLSEAWITHCDIKEAKWSDFAGLNNLHRLYMFNCNLERLEPLHFPNLKSLWISGNRLPSLSFLGQGLPSLLTLNVAKNDITCLLDEQLFKCVNLHTLNLSGNPICTVQDVQAVKVLSSLQTLFLADPIYGKCPVAALCDSRTMLLSILTGISSLDGKVISLSELTTIQDYVSTRALFYYANSVRSVASQVMNRRTIVVSTNKKLEIIGQRILDLIALAARYRRVLSSVDIVPIFTNAKNLLKDQLMKIEDRMNKLKEWVAVTLRRREIVMLISRWEQEAEKWMKWIEFRSFGNTQCHIIHSVHGSVLNDSNFLFTCLHQLMSALSCPGLWPQNMMLKIETIVVLKDIGMEIGLQRTYDDCYAPNDEPAFIPPQESNGSLLQNTTASNSFMGQQYPFYSFPAMPPKPVTTYLSPDYKPPEPVFPFPESVAGLPERAQPVFMFLMCPPSAASNPLVHLHRIITEKSRHYKDIRLTNCLWFAINRTKNFSVVIIVKVLMEALQGVHLDKRGCNHSTDCSVFSLKKPLAFTPAYLVNISFTPDDKHCFWQKWTTNDADIIAPAENALMNLTGKIASHGHPSVSKVGGTKKSPYVRKVGEGVVADLSASELFINRDGTIHCGTPIPENCTSQSLFDVQEVSKFIGGEVSQILTSLDLSGNNLSLLVGLEGLTTLKKLNLCHNKLTTIASLNKLPNLIEMRLGWNCLRFFLSTALVLQHSVPRLMTLEILPNPFQDIRDPSHIPIILKRGFAVLHRVDIWISPFQTQPSLFCKKLYSVADCGFSHVAMVKSWVGTALSYNDLASKCLTDLDLLPKAPPFPEGFGSNGMDLNLSDNYLSSTALAAAHFVHSTEWRTSLVKLQLQENSISSLDWMKDTAFPNIQILNLSNNRLTEINPIANACPSLRHLALSCNPLPRDVTLVLSPIRLLENLNTLDCTACPVASHPEYGAFVIKHLASVKILDGTPMKDWGMSDSVESMGGVLTGDWLEEKLGNKNWSSLTQLSLPNSNLQKISLPPHCLPKLMTLDLGDNFLTSLTSLSSLPSLRVLCVSHNSISALGSTPCPTCFSQTALSQASNAKKSRNVSLTGILTSDSFGKPPTVPSWGVKSSSSTTIPLNGTEQYSPPAMASDGAPASRKCPPKALFPKLEVLILSHNGLSSISDLHLHSMPQLQTIMLNCNNLTSLQGLENLPTVKAIVLDHNRITDVPHNSLTGCRSLKYLHLEHNRITAIPRLPHLTNLSALHLSHNKIQNLTEMGQFAQNALSELSLQDNPVSTKCAFRLRVAAKLPQLNLLDGRELHVERSKLQDLTKKWYPSSGLSIRDHTLKDPVQNESKRNFDSKSESASRQQQQQRPGSEFPSRAPPSQLGKSSLRGGSQFTGYVPTKRNFRQ